MEFDVATGTEVLQRTPRTLEHMLGGLSPAWTEANEGPDTWSAYVIVGHLTHADRTDWIPRARVILAQGDDRRFPPFDRFGQLRASEGKSLAQLLEEFAQVRAESLATLASWRLEPAHLELTGEHPAFGTVTLRQLLATWVAHDLGHIAQIARVMARQYRDAVGPWSEYISALKR